MNPRPHRSWLSSNTAALCAILAILLVGALTAGWKASEVDRDMRSALRAEAERLAATLNPRRLAMLTGTTADLDLPEYQRLKKQLQAVRHAFPSDRFIYLMLQRPDGAVVFLLDSQAPGSTEESPPGQIFTEVSTDVLQFFQSRIALTTPATSDRWGRWVSALVPVTASAAVPGRLALGIDIDARDWNRQILRQGVAPIALAALALILIVMGGQTLIARRARHDSAGSSALHHVELGMVLLVGLVLTIVASWLIQTQANRFQSGAFHLVADASAQGITVDLHNLRDFGLGALGRFFEASDQVTAEEFAHYSDHLIRSGLARHWAWAPELPAAERAGFEQSVRADGRADFHIWGADMASPAGLIYPITHYISSVAETPPLGLELGSLERVRLALESARRTGLITALSGLEGSYVPTWRGLTLIIEPTTRPNPSRGHNGFAMSSVDFDSILAAWAGDDLLMLELWQLEVDGSRELMARYGSSARRHFERAILERPVLVFGESYLIRIEPGPGIIGAQRSLAGAGMALSGGLLTLLLATVVSLVTRRRASLEQAVRERTAALQEFRSAVEQTTEGIALSDMQGRIRFVNRAWADLHGYQAEELIGQPLSIFHTPEQFENQVTPQLDQLVQIGEGSGEVDHLHRDGHSFPTRMSTTLARDESGRPFGMIGVARDISDEVARRKRELFEQRFRALMADMAAQFVTARDDQSLQRVLQTGLAAFGELFGVDRSYLFRFSRRHNSMSNIVEWCAPGVDSSLSSMQSMPMSLFPWWMGRMQEKRPLQIAELAALPPEAAHEKAIFESEGVQSLICLPILDTSGELSGFIGFDSVHRAMAWPPEQVRMLQTIADITAAALARHEAARALAESESSYRDLAQESRSFRWEVDMDGLYTEVDPLVTQVLGYQPEELVGKKHFFDLAPPDQRDEIRQVGLENLRSGRKAIGYENPVLRRDGQISWVSTTLLPVRDPDGRLVGGRGSDTDITARKQAELQLQHLAHHDLLTGLPNRALLADRLQQAMLQAERRGELLGVACVDLDAFKPINDLYGHAVGDRMLVTIAQRMRETLREGDTVARLGGDEFALVLVGLESIDDCQPLLGRLLEAVAQPMEEDGNLLSVSVSLGITFFPQAEDIDADQLLRQADQAMYEAKLAGRNRFHLFDAANDRQIREKHQQIERIRQALELDEFLLHYQPKVDMKTGALIGFEALIRWQHPERGPLPPAEFLPLLENHQLMLRLGDWVIDSVLRQITHWRRAGLAIPVSLNVNPLQLAQTDFMQRLREILQQYPEVQPGDLDLEVLESSALDDAVPMVDIIRQGEELGVSFSLDDFGTGYSSLSYLKRLPVSTLKIDRSFVREMLGNPEDLAILQGIISLARTFQQQVIAEGVETEAHGQILLWLGCRLGQGYAIAHPMPATEVQAWLAGWQPPLSWKNAETIDAQGLRLLLAMVEYRAWVKLLRQSLEEAQPAVASLDEPAMEFLAWLRGDGASIADQAQYLRLHQQLLAQAGELSQLAAQGQRDEAIRRFQDILLTRDELLEALRRAIVAG